MGESKSTERTSLIAPEAGQNPQTAYSIKRLATVILTYCRACSWLMTFLTLLFYVLMSGASVAAGYWLAEWSNAEAEGSGALGSSTEKSNSSVCNQENGPIL